MSRVAPSTISLPPMGIMAPLPRVVDVNSLTNGQKLEIRPSEPVYLYLPMYIEGGMSIEGLNKNSPFKLSPATRPMGAVQPRTPGQWVKISVAPATKPGQTDHVRLVDQWSIGDARLVRETKARFVLESGAMRYY